MAEIEPKVFCAYDSMVALNELKPNPENPNTHPQEQIELLAKIIERNGWRSPITVSTRSGMIVKGHGRYQAAQLLELEKVPVDFQDYESESLELADLMADNRIAELSKNDNRKLLNLFEKFDTGEVDFDLSGYKEDQYQNLAHSFDEYQPDEEDEDEPKSKKKKLRTTTCPNCGHVFEVIE